MRHAKSSESFIKFCGFFFQLNIPTLNYCFSIKLMGGIEV